MDFSFQWLIENLVSLIEQIGYPGIFLFSMLGSTFLPLPEELTLIPAGYLIYQGKMSAAAVFFSAVTGSMTGSCLNYWLAVHYGRRLFMRYGKLFLLKPEKLAKIENYFVEHGAISVFTGRLLPGAKHYIAFPAGLARMRLKPFLIYLTLACALWIGLLIFIGYEIGSNQEMISVYMRRLKYSLLVFAVIVVGIYSLLHWRKKKAGLS